MNRREVFDKVAKHLLDQGKQSKLNARMCAYRGKDGLSCAVGCLIPDDLYEYRMEGTGIECLLADFPALDDLLGKHVQLLGDLQTLHDRGHVNTWENQLDDMRASL